MFCSWHSSKKPHLFNSLLQLMRQLIWTWLATKNNFGQFFFKYKSSPNFGLLLSTIEVLQKWVGLHFGWFFHKLIWSPGTYVVQDFYSICPFSRIDFVAEEAIGNSKIILISESGHNCTTLIPCTFLRSLHKLPNAKVSSNNIMSNFVKTTNCRKPICRASTLSNL
jgi:hypothetical protein